MCNFCCTERTFLGNLVDNHLLEGVNCMLLRGSNKYWIPLIIVSKSQFHLKEGCIQWQTWMLVPLQEWHMLEMQK